MWFARGVFLGAGIYGLLILVPMLGLEQQIGVDQPPAISHPEYFYGFLGVAIAWQIAFLLIARDPVRFRPMMLPAMVEKFSFATAAVLLFLFGRLATSILAGGIVDGLLGILFVVAYQKTRAAAKEQAA